MKCMYNKVAIHLTDHCINIIYLSLKNSVVCTFIFLATYEYIIFYILLLYLYTNRPKVTSINLINRKIQENDDGNKIFVS